MVSVLFVRPMNIATLELWKYINIVAIRIRWVSHIMGRPITIGYWDNLFLTE